MSIDLKKTFKKFEDDYLDFDEVVDRPSNRRDLCAFMFLGKLVPGKENIVSSAEHDEITLEADLDTLSQVATEDDILYLVRCGVMYSDEFECLHMFV